MDMNILLSIVIALFCISILGFVGAPLMVWTAFAAALLLWAGAVKWVWILFIIFAAIFNIRPVRQILVSGFLLKWIQAAGLLPHISETEMTAIKAGSVWVEGELFSGKPNFDKLLNQKFPSLSAEEQAFVDGPVEEVCKMITDWELHKTQNLPEEVWAFFRKHKFFGMIIPKTYGGLEFSALGHSAVIMKLASRSGSLAITAMVPNSLGPAELLIHYGTEEQKKYWLPRLASGEEIPCFALTEPHAGSDAGSIHSHGEVFRGEDGKLYIRLNWNKRWITLAAVSTVLGLAFRLYDPENLLGTGKSDLGITCALVPSHLKGVDISERHDPLGMPFVNSPAHGKDVVVPLDAIIGGPEMAGKGWMMLMESLAAGRGISLPSVAVAATKYCSRIVGAYATVRKQFGMSIGKFEGISEPLARVVGYNYILDAARRYTLGAIDGGSKPPVVTAICKYYFTELQRRAVNDGMDILGGSGISRGPKNLLAPAYEGLPISITVEGANILTRTLIIFGQGALRAHPYAFKEVQAMMDNNVKEFDRALFGHIGHVVRNAARAKLLCLTRGWLAKPARGGITAKYYRKLAWSSALFAILADISMGSLGAQLKSRGKITGRFADILGWMYLITATLKRFEAEGRLKEDEVLLQWSMEYGFNEIQQAFINLLPWPFKWFMLVNPIGQPPGDHLDLQLAALIQKPSAQRDRLTDGIFVSSDFTEHAPQLEKAFQLTVSSDAVSYKIRKAVKSKRLEKTPAANLNQRALDKNIITAEEFAIISDAEKERDLAIQVDSFNAKDYGRH